MCSKPEAMLEKLLQKRSAFYAAPNVVEFAAVLAGRFRGSIDEWKKVLVPVVSLRVDTEHVNTVTPCFVQVRDMSARNRPLGYVSTVTLAANPQRFKQVNAASRAMASVS